MGLGLLYDEAVDPKVSAGSEELKHLVTDPLFVGRSVEIFEVEARLTYAVFQLI